jgi:hypothetical protein
MRLPNADRVAVDVRKVAEYLLSSTHPVGRHKARYFIALGFSNADTGAFIAEIRRIAATEDVASIEDTQFGRKYTVVGQLTGAAATAEVETVWIQEHGQPFVRLVTVLPRSS